MRRLVLTCALAVALPSSAMARTIVTDQAPQTVAAHQILPVLAEFDSAQISLSKALKSIAEGNGFGLDDTLRHLRAKLVLLSAQLFQLRSTSNGNSHESKGSPWVLNEPGAPDAVGNPGSHEKSEEGGSAGGTTVVLVPVSSPGANAAPGAAGETGGFGLPESGDPNALGAGESETSGSPPSSAPPPLLAALENPEPATWLVMILSFAALALARRPAAKGIAVRFDEG